MVANIQNPNQGSGEQQIKFWIKKMVQDEIAQYARSQPMQSNADGVIIVNENTGIQSSNYVAGVSGWRLSGTQIETHTSIAGFATSQTALCSATNFALTTTATTLASGTVTVPNGFTKCAVILLAQMYVINPNTTGGSNTTGGDYLTCRAVFDTVGSSAMPFGVTGSGGGGVATSLGSPNFTGLTPGASIGFSVEGWTSFNPIAANTSNTIYASLGVFWSP